MSKREPDYKVASLISWLSAGANVVQLIGIDRETLQRARLLADSIYDAITDRGARVAEIVEVIRAVKPHDDELEELKTVRERPPMKPRDV